MAGMILRQMMAGMILRQICIRAIEVKGGGGYRIAGKTRRGLAPVAILPL